MRLGGGGGGLGVKNISPLSWGGGGQNRIDPKANSDSEKKVRIRGKADKRFPVFLSCLGKTLSCYAIKNISGRLLEQKRTIDSVNPTGIKRNK